ncbi:hypothetical protein [Paenibacillus maysiensis]|uniref:hypothetical protein n=1 Tax=Paenibacillus maysiensis TaxID=1155954 RepID=UPI0004AC6046|nr:hypothetical protein [Paenibacillus maysiensis]
MKYFLKKYGSTRFNSTDTRLDNMEQRFDIMDSRLDGMEDSPLEGIDHNTVD